MKKINSALLAILGASVIAVPAMAVTPYDAITTAADWTDVTTALGVVAAALALVLVFRKGARMILGFFGR